MIDIMDMNSKEIEEEENKEECSEVLVSESQGKQSKIIIWWNVSNSNIKK